MTAQADLDAFARERYRQYHPRWVTGITIDESYEIRPNDHPAWLALAADLNGRAQSHVDGFDSFSMRFSDVADEADAEMAAWDALLHPKPKERQ